MPRALTLILACQLLLGCATAPDRGDTVGSPGNPVLIVAYSPNETVRVGFEDRLQADLAAKGVLALPSHEFVDSFALLNRRLLLEAAEDRHAPMILMLRRLITELPDDGTGPPKGVERHRTLQEYFRNADRSRLPDLPPPGRQVIEVAGYLRNERATELVWSGFSWVDFDGDLDAAIRETSDIIARNLAPACEGISCDF